MNKKHFKHSPINPHESFYTSIVTNHVKRHTMKIHTPYQWQMCIRDSVWKPRYCLLTHQPLQVNWYAVEEKIRMEHLEGEAVVKLRRAKSYPIIKELEK